METSDPEIDAMRRIWQVIEALEPDAQRRVATWLDARIAGSQAPPRSRVPSDQPRDTGVDQMALADFMRLKAPRTKTERLLCLVFWAEAHSSDGGVPTRYLNELNRDTDGSRFSDASSMAQSAIGDKGYIARVSPGRLALTARGRHLVMALPHLNGVEP